MIEFFDSLFSSIKGRSRLKGSLRFFLRISSNVVFPVYFKLFSHRKNNIRNQNSRDRRIIVSLTSFPARINKIWLIMECMFRQTVPPDLIVLYLSKEQFPQEFNSIPQRLNNLYNLGYIDIIFTEGDLRSHKKYIYSFQQYREEIVILIDDDLFYTKRLIQELMDLHHEFPGRIICHRGHLVTRDSENKINPYSKWKVLRTKGGPSSKIFHTSGGATLYEPKLFNTDLFNVQNIKSLCFYADDVWLNIHAFISGIKIVKTNYYSDYLPILNIKDVHLSDLNVAEGMNDQQIIKTIKYYGIDEKDIFND